MGVGGLNLHEEFLVSCFLSSGLSVALRKRFGNVPKAESKSAHSCMCPLTSVHDETAGEVWDKVIQQTTGNNKLSCFPCWSNYATDMASSKWNWCRKLPLRSSGSGELPRDHYSVLKTGRQPGIVGNWNDICSCNQIKEPFHKMCLAHITEGAQFSGATSVLPASLRLVMLRFLGVTEVTQQLSDVCSEALNVYTEKKDSNLIN